MIYPVRISHDGIGAGAKPEQQTGGLRGYRFTGRKGILRENGCFGRSS
jgi:hypothetical protein